MDAFLLGEGDEAESTRNPCLAVNHHSSIQNCSKLGEIRVENVAGTVERQAADEDLPHLVGSPLLGRR